jgi:2'-5' RNA ligase
MAFALTLHFDSGIADAISCCWKRLADAGISRSMLDLGYPPHVTLAVHDRPTIDASLAALDRVFEKMAEIGVALTGVTTFGAGSGVCYAALAASPDLIQLQAAVVGAMGSGCRPHYQIGDWTPHCTLGTGASDADIGRAKALLEQHWRPVRGAFAAAELVEFAPVVGIRRWGLRALPPPSHRP